MFVVDSGFRVSQNSCNMVPQSLVKDLSMEWQPDTDAGSNVIFNSSFECIWMLVSWRFLSDCHYFKGSGNHCEEQFTAIADEPPRTISSRVPRLIWDFTKAPTVIQAAARLHKNAGHLHIKWDLQLLVNCADNSLEAGWAWNGFKQQWPFKSIMSPFTREFKRNWNKCLWVSCFVLIIKCNDAHGNTENMLSC